MKIPACPKSGKELIIVFTRRLIEGIALTERRGRITLKTRRDLSWILKRKKSTTLYKSLLFNRNTT
jgi:hypothetical protein